MAIKILECLNIGLHYPGNNYFTLKDINFAVEADQIVALLGESGCGKTSLLNVASGLIPATSGQVLFKGQPITTTPNGVSVVFQDACLLPWLNVAKNVAFGLGFKSLYVPKTERNCRVEAALKEVGLLDAADKYPAALSGGMAQRVSLARTLVRRSELSFLDEPFSSLDAITRRSMQQLLLNLLRAHRSSALLVTHDLDEALALADRLILIGREAGGTKLADWDLNSSLGTTGSPAAPNLRLTADHFFQALRAEISGRLSADLTD
ncbi:MAG: ABC transporter ATP-binding protein [Deltaproteobacteria bacterium]|jgi:NitT/TauT family transport system ATP-binding protein|nr:ABC transporter ATP-binding protein [Deltaproteobacteria bacterium]